jgi:hypothetical protein
MGRRLALTTATFGVALLGVAGCGGGGESARQDADEPSGTWTVEVVDASFPERQHLAKQQTMRIAVHNASNRAIPNAAVTVDSFTRRSEQTGLADGTRPVWIVDDAPTGGATAYVNTWAVGRIEAGDTKTLEWRVTPVVAGTHKITYRVAAGLDGKAKARDRDGGRVEGTFRVSVSRRPAQARVNAETGAVERR